MISSLGDDGGAMKAFAKILSRRMSQYFQLHYLSFLKYYKENKSSILMNCSSNI